MVHHPDPWQVPTADGNQRPISVQQNVHLPADANDVDKSALMHNAQEIVDGNANALHRFVNNQRQQQSMGGWNYRAAQMVADGMKARWLYNLGIEKLIVDVFPTGQTGAGARTSDRNLDGYLCWIHAQPGYPKDTDYYGQPVKIGPFALILNGYALETNLQPRSHFGQTNCSMYAVLFGKSALLANSHADTDRKNPLKGVGLREPYPLVPDSSGVVDSATECDGTAQPAISEKLGYWIFDWLSVHNPCSFIKVNSTGRGWRWNQVSTEYSHGWAFGLYNGRAALGEPNMAGGIYFPDVRENMSPLKPLGQNVIGTTPAAGAISTFVPCLDCFVGEFYDRGKYTVLSQSWHVPARAKRQIVATTKPVLFAGLDYQSGYSTGGGSNLKFSLDPHETKDGKGLGQMGPHDYFKVDGFNKASDGPGDAITDAQRAEIDAWRAANAVIMADYYAKFQRDIDNWQTEWADDGPHAHELTKAYNMRGWLNTHTDAEGNVLDWVKDDDRVHATNRETFAIVYGPTQEYMYDWNAAFDGVNPLPIVKGHYYLHWEVWAPAGDLITNDPPDPAIYGSDFAGGGWMTRAAMFDYCVGWVKTDAVVQKAKAYDDIMKQPTPKLKPFPNTGKGIEDFKYSRISDSWTFNQTP